MIAQEVLQYLVRCIAALFVIGILTVMCFGAYGKHIKNILPIFLGVFLGSITKVWNIDDPHILLAALFGTGLAPIIEVFRRKKDKF
jgi:hypothetical protein